MHPTIQTLKNAIGYAKFSDSDVKDATLNLVNELGSDLEGDDYEQGAGVEEAEIELTTLLNNVDNDIEDTDEAIKNADASENEDEDEE